MTISLPLEPSEEAKLIALAQARGLSADALVRQAIDRLLEDTPDESRPSATGAAVVAAMQASPYREIDIEPDRFRMSVHNVTL